MVVVIYFFLLIQGGYRVKLHKSGYSTNWLQTQFAKPSMVSVVILCENAIGS